MTPPVAPAPHRPAKKECDACLPQKALIRWKITGGTDAVLETPIADGTRTIRAGRSDAEPRTTPVTGRRRVPGAGSGDGNPVTTFRMRKLKVAGDVGLASGPTRCVGIPKA